MTTLIEHLKKSSIVEFDSSGCDLNSEFLHLGHYDDIEMMIDMVLQHTKNIKIWLYEVNLNKFIRLFNGEYKIVISDCDGVNFNGDVKSVAETYIYTTIYI